MEPPTPSEQDREAIDAPPSSGISRKNRRFLQFSMRQLLLLFALSGTLLGILAPRIHRTFRFWQMEESGHRVDAAQKELMLAVRANDEPLARRALEAGADPDFMSGQGYQGRGRLIYTCIANGQIEMVKLLLDFGAEAEVGIGGSPLLAAVGCDQPQEVRRQMIGLLVAAGANPQQQAAMDLAVQRSDGPMGDLMREYGVPYGPREMAAFNRLDELRQAVDDDPELLTRRFKSHLATTGLHDGPTLLAFALYRGYREMSLFLIDAGAPLDTRQHMGRTLLHEAAMGGDPELIRLLVSRGLDVNAIDDHFKDTPLEYAAGYDRREAVAALLEASSDVNHQDGSGRTFLHAAVLGNRVEVVRMLLAAGADPTIANKQGTTALDVARAHNPAMVELLEHAIKPAPQER